MWSRVVSRLIWWVSLVGAGLSSACTSQAPEPSESRSELGERSVPEIADPSARGLVERERALKKFSESLAPRLSRSREGLTSHRTEAGSRRIPLDGRFRSAHVAVRSADGSVRTHCVTSKAELDALLKRGRP